MGSEANSRWCQNRNELEDTQLVLGNWLMWGECHTFGGRSVVNSREYRRKTALFEFLKSFSWCLF